MNRRQTLRDRVAGCELVQAMAAHSPLAGRLAEEAGFDAIWASGFELSALFGLPDASLITMTNHLEMTRAIAANTSLPVIADIDTGFGNAINVIHAVHSYERAGVDAVVIEDKTFPKMTSLLQDGRQELLRIEEFQGKIEAACMARESPDFLIIARTEALIAGLGEAEALRRAHAYVEAGADLILVHSKSRTPDEIVRFAAAWRGPASLVIVPTSYPDLSLERVRALRNIAILIYGNHAIRASVAAMQKTFAAILRDGNAAGVADDIATVGEVFRLQNMDGLKRNEEAFLR